MTLRVHCPAGCLIRVPGRYAGKVVRCPGCQATLQLPQVSNTELDRNRTTSIRAALVRSSTSQTSDRPTAQNKPASPAERVPSPATESTVDSSDGDQKDRSKPLDGSDQHSTRVARKRLSTPAPLRRDPPPAELPMEPPPISVVGGESIPGSASASQPAGQPSGSFLQASKDEEQMLNQFRASTSDRKILARFYSACVFCTGIFNLVPAIYFWLTWDQVGLAPDWPRWAYLQVFIAGLHIIYAIYLYQIPDWSTLRTIAFAMLVLAMLYGVVSSGLLIGGGQGIIAHFLMLPSDLLNQAAIWCVAMLCLATLISYLTGRESALWCRTEKLLNQILTG